jgi:hexosaminidase
MSTTVLKVAMIHNSAIIGFTRGESDVKTKKHLALLLFSISVQFAFAQVAPATLKPLHIMPMPARITAGNGQLPLDAGFKACVTGRSDSLLNAAVDRFLQKLQKKTGIPLDPSPSTDKQIKFEIQCKEPGEQVQSVAADESYVLEISSRDAQLTAVSPVGVLRGLETFLQLVDLDSNSFYVPALKIEDSPRFRWRGLHVDVSRHWEPIDVIKRILDSMSAVKLNVFHWHLSDDQGFRVESKIFPRLHQKGSDGKYYRQSEIKEVVAYARARGIRVVPEFDMPGHTTALLVAYPELAGAPGPYQIERSWGVFDPCMDPTKQSVYTFLDSFIGEMTTLFPDEYFHIGGDEVNGKQWSTSKRIRSFMARENIKNNHELQAYFNRQLLKILKKYGKKMIGWDEILNPELPKNIAIQSWRGQASLAESARLGYQGILSYGYYLDHMKPASFHYEIDPLGKEAASLSEKEQARIIGGEACMWAEFVNPDNIESRIWPRAAAIAERLWSPAATADIADMYRRLAYVDRELAASGSMHRSNHIQMLRRMIGDQNQSAFIDWTDLLNATSLSVRQRTRKYYSYTPMNGLADSVRPESEASRQFAFAVDSAHDRLYRSPESLDAIMKQLSLWKDAVAQLKPIFDQSYLLVEAKSLLELFEALDKTGLESLGYISSGQKAPESWQKEAYALLDRADKPNAEVMIAIAPSIRKLVNDAATGF